MDDSGLVRERHAFGSARDNGQRLGDIERPLALDSLPRSLARDKSHDEVVEAVLAGDAVYTNQVRARARRPLGLRSGNAR